MVEFNEVCECGHSNLYHIDSKCRKCKCNKFVGNTKYWMR